MISLLSVPLLLTAQTSGFARVLTYDSLRLASGDRKLAEKLRVSSGGTLKLAEFTDLAANLDNGYLTFSLTAGETPQLFIPSQLRYRGPDDYTWQGRTADGLRVCRLEMAKGRMSGLYLDYENREQTLIVPGQGLESILITEGFSYTDPIFCETNDLNATGAGLICTDDPCAANITLLLVFVPESQAFLGAENNAFIEQRAIDEIELAWGANGINNSLTIYSAFLDGYEFGQNHSCCTDEKDALSQLPALANLREQYRADITIVLAPENYVWIDGDKCGSRGCATIEATNAEEAIALLPVNFFVTNANRYVLSHEIGHLFGSHHNSEVDIFPYEENCAFGYLIDGNKSTIMYTSSGVGPASYDRRLVYSDPSIFIYGLPVGDEDHNTAGRIKQRGCAVADFQPEIAIHSFIYLSSPGCDLLTLSANSTGTTADLIYEWRWSYDGLFTVGSPGTYLGSGASLSVLEPVDDPCANYFIALYTYLGSKEVAFTTQRTRGGACLENVWCPEPGLEKSIRPEITRKPVRPVREVFYNPSGQLLLINERGPWWKENDPRAHLGKLPAGIYFLRTEHTDGTTTARKIFIPHE